MKRFALVLLISPFIFFLTQPLVFLMEKYAEQSSICVIGKKSNDGHLALFDIKNNLLATFPALRYVDIKKIIRISYDCFVGNLHCT